MPTSGHWNMLGVVFAPPLSHPEGFVLALGVYLSSYTLPRCVLCLSGSGAGVWGGVLAFQALQL